MTQPGITILRKTLAAIGLLLVGSVAIGQPAPSNDEELLLYGRQANEALRRCRDFVRGWLAYADPVSGLIPRNLRDDRDKWNGRDCAADNYPFMVLTSALVDRPAVGDRMLEILRQEQALTSRLGHLVDWYSFRKQGFLYDQPDLDRMIFDSAEYAKDGLMPLTEYLGRTVWSRRMLGLVDDIWKFAAVPSPGGPVPSDNVEVNGEIMQVTSRLFWMTGEERYLDWACRLADYYLLGGRHPTRDLGALRLRDHGCELISGLSEVYYACCHRRPEKARQYRSHIHSMLDRILEVGVNPDGMMYDEIDPRDGRVLRQSLSDNWGYNYNAYYTVYQLDGVDKYRQAVVHALRSVGRYRNYRWEGDSHDGYADSIESALNLFNREPVAAAADWIDSEMRVMMDMQKPDGIIGGWHGDGNFARTAVMYALWKQQGMTLQPWRADLELGARPSGSGVSAVVKAEWPWEGQLICDIPRHRLFMGMPGDYPRINQLPEWYTVDAGARYVVSLGEEPTREVEGKELISGLELRIAGGQAIPVKIERR